MARLPGDAPDSPPRPSGPRRSKCERSSDPHSASGCWRGFSRWTSPRRRSPRSPRRHRRRADARAHGLYDLRDRLHRRAKDYTNGRTDLMLMKKDGSNKTVLLAGATGCLSQDPGVGPGRAVDRVLDTSPRRAARSESSRRTARRARTSPRSAQDRRSWDGGRRPPPGVLARLQRFARPGRAAS